MQISAEELYADVIQAAMLDEEISADEDSIIRVIADTLGLPRQRAEMILSQIAAGKIPDLDLDHRLSREKALECFYQAWVTAAGDSSFTQDEMKLLAMLAYALQINAEQRREVQKRAVDERPASSNFANKFSDATSGVFRRLRGKDRAEKDRPGGGILGKMTSAASTAAGVGLAAGSKVKDVAGEATGKARSTAGKVAQSDSVKKAKEVAGEAAGKVRSTAGKVAQSDGVKKAKGIAGSAAHKARETAGDALEKASDLKDAAVEKVKHTSGSEE